MNLIMTNESNRLISLDVFRGLTVVGMVLVNNPGSWAHIHWPLEHAEWNGWTPTDLIFPFFLFIVGVAIPLGLGKRVERGDKFKALFLKILYRSVVIFLLGEFLAGFPYFHFSTIRIPGVLQRIAVCYFFASVLIYYLKPRKAFYAGLVLLLIYWMLCYVGNPTDPYSLTGWFGTNIDKKILGVSHLYRGEGVAFDPEGLMSTISAIVEVIFGFMVGDYIQKKGKTYEMVTGLFVAGVAMLITGFCWDMVFPINKKIWTSSYTVYTSGLATITIATMIYLIEFKNVKGGLARFFDVFGKNALFVFALSAFLPKGLALIRIPDHLNEKGEMIYTNPWNALYQKVWIHIPGDPRIGSLLFALSVITFMWIICWWLDRKKIYIKV